MKVRGIGVLRHKSAQIVELSLFLLGKDNKREMVYASIKYELYLVKGLSTNILIGNNILTPEGFVLNIGLGYAVVESYDVKITIEARQRGQF